VLAEVQRSFGGTMSSVGQRYAAWKPSYALIWTNAAAAKLVAAIAPYSTVKSRQAAVLLQFQRHVERCTRIRDSLGHLLPLSDREREIRESFYQRVKHLNTRDVAVRRLMRGGNRKRRKSRTLSDRYLAGFIDGEGSLMINKAENRKNWNPSYRPRISISNTDRFVLEEIRQTYGGILVYEPRVHRGWNNAYQLIWVGGMVAQVISSIKPYLQIKQPQAAVLSSLLRHISETRQGRQGSNGGYFAFHPDKVVAFRERLYRRIRKLNAKGVRPGVASNAKEGERPGRKSISRSAFQRSRCPPMSRRSITASK